MDGAVQCAQFRAYFLNVAPPFAVVEIDGAVRMAVF